MWCRTAAPQGSLQGFLVLTAVLFLEGCGGPGAPDLGKPMEVKGTVTMDSAPAAGVDVTFTRMGGEAAPDARQFIAQTDANGKFTLPKVFPGDYQVMVIDPVEAKQREEQNAAEETGKYKNYGVSSPLTAKVSEGSTEFKFDLSSQ